ncbi:MAG: hypothetical protein KJ950_00375 [Proteobacteria bacterium]|nr:hypothetical protein [Pseudomonadota bacterium]MBU1686143.1 hypothetical protein [Pseudomonadota bacterium]
MHFMLRLKKLFPLLALLILLPLSVGLVLAADSKELANQIQKSFSSVKRNIVTNPQKAETELAETMGMLEELKAADPANSQIPRLEEQVEKFNKDLAKRLGRNVKPVTRATAAPKTPVVAAPSVPATPQVAAPSRPSSPVVQTGAKDNSTLPSAVVSRIKKIDQGLEKAQKALDNQSIQRAELEFKSATKIYAEIEQRYAADAPADHPDMVAVAGRMSAVNTLIESAAKAAAGEMAVKAEAEAANQSLAENWIAKLDPFITRDNAKYLDKTGWGKEAADFARVRQSYGEAEVVFAEYQQVDFPLGKPMELQNSENSLRSTLDTLRSTYAQEDTAKASEAWLAKLEPFVSSMGSKTLIVGFTSNVSEMKSQKSIFDEASKLFEQYLQADFPLGKSPGLQRVEDELADLLAKFPEGLQRSMAAQSGNAEQKLDQEIAFLKSKEEWRNDSSKRPYCLSDERINDARKLVDTAAGLLPAGDPSLVRMQGKMASLVQMNNERRTINAERTRMVPDTFGGDGKGEIKQTAEGLVSAKITGSKILRTTVISEDWKEESVQEWTDTTQTAVRFRTTRSVTAQVAAKKSDGEVRLYTLAIAKDRRTDGSWGKLYGNLHSDLGDLMLEENVKK